MAGPAGPADNSRSDVPEPDLPGDVSGGDAGSEPSPEPPAPVEETEYVLSNQTTRQTYQDRSDCFTLPNDGPNSAMTLTGQEMDIPGVSDRAQVTISRDDDGDATVRLDSAWNSVKNVFATNEGAADVTLDNFVHADVALGDGGDSKVTITGAKRGFVQTGDGDDEISISAQSNGPGWSNTFSIDSGAGDDNVSVEGAPNGFSRTNIDAGAGDDRVVSRNQTTDTISGGSGDDRIDAGEGDDDLSGDEGEDTLIGGAGADRLDGEVGRVAFTAEPYAGAERNNDSSDYLIRVFEWVSSEETDISAAGDDRLDGGAGNDWVQGGEDDGSVSFASRVNVEFVDSNAGYNNSFGYYRAADDGNPVDGRIIWNNLNSTPDGAAYSIRLNNVDVEDVGFFLVPNGDRKNAGLDLDQGDKVRFRLEDGEWVAQTKVDGQWTTLDGQSSNAYFSDDVLNPDGIAHMQTGTDGVQGWEDLRGGGDRDYNDAEVRANVSWEVRGFEAGDRLSGGDGEDDFFYQSGDGVDEIDDFEIGADRLVINGYEAADVAFIQSGDDTVLKLGDNEAVRLNGVDADVLAGRTGTHTVAVDEDTDGHLDVGEVISAQDDFFGDRGGTAPSAQDTSVVFLTPAAPEPGLGGDMMTARPCSAPAQAGAPWAN